VSGRYVKWRYFVWSNWLTLGPLSSAPTPHLRNNVSQLYEELFALHWSTSFISAPPAISIRAFEYSDICSHMKGRFFIVWDSTRIVCTLYHTWHINGIYICFSQPLEVLGNPLSLHRFLRHVDSNNIISTSCLWRLYESGLALRINSCIFAPPFISGNTASLRLYSTACGVLYVHLMLFVNVGTTAQ